MDRTSVRLLCCPQCSAALIDTPDNRLDCSACSLRYPIHDGVPVLLIGEATSRPAPTDDEFERLIREAAAAPFPGWTVTGPRQPSTAQGARWTTTTPARRRWSPEPAVFWTSVPAMAVDLRA